MEVQELQSIKTYSAHLAALDCLTRTVSATERVLGVHQSRPYSVRAKRACEAAEDSRV